MAMKVSICNNHAPLDHSTYSLFIREEPPVIRFIKQPRSWAVEVGKPFSLVCKAVASSGGVSYQWYKDDHILPDQQTERLVR